MAGTKRKKGKSDAQDDGAGPSKQSKQAGPASKNVNIPVDEGFTESAQVHVYIDDENGDIWDASLNQTNVGNNANKFYRLQLLQADDEKFFAHLRWGRVGEFGQAQTSGPTSFQHASRTFKKKFREKSGLAWEDRLEEPKKGKYTFIEKNYEEDQEGDDQESDKKKKNKSAKTEEAKVIEEIPSKLPVETQSLVQLIFNENHFNSVLASIGYNQDKLPLGKLGQGTLTKGFQYLKDLAGLIKDSGNGYQSSQQQAIVELTNKYYSTIPHVFGRHRPPTINTTDLLQREVEMLDTLSDMEVASDIMKVTEDMAKDEVKINLLDRRFEQLGMDELTPLDTKTNEFKLLKDYLVNTAGHSHNIKYKLHDIFRITRNGEDERFQKSEFSGIKNSYRCLLWHGSRTTNFGGILSQGTSFFFRVPSARRKATKFIFQAVKEC